MDRVCVILFFFLCVCVCVCVCLCESRWRKSARRMARTSNTGDTSSEDPEQQAQRKEKYNKSKRPFSSIDHCHPYRRKRMVCACECACCCCTCDVVKLRSCICQKNQCAWRKRCACCRGGSGSAENEEVARLEVANLAGSEEACQLVKNPDNALTLRDPLIDAHWTVLQQVAKASQRGWPRLARKYWIAEWTLVHSQRNPKHAIFCCIALCRGQNGFFKGYMHQNYPLFRAELGHGCFLRWRVCPVVVFVEEKWVALVLGVKLEVAVLKLSLNVMCCKCKLATKRMNSVEHSLPGRYTLNPIIFGERWEFSEYTFCIFALAVSQQSSPLHRRDFIFRFLLKGENTLWKLQPGPSWWELKDLMKIDQVVER